MSEVLESVIREVKSRGGSITIAEDYEESRQFGENGQITSNGKYEEIEDFGIHQIKSASQEVYLNHFVDGIQRSLSISKVYVKDIGYLPAYYVMLASAVVERDNGQIGVWSLGEELANIREIGVFPSAEIEGITPFGNTWHYPAHTKSSGNYLSKVCDKVRRDLEKECIVNWGSAFKAPHYLLVDGGIFTVRQPRVIGLIKSINSTYIPPADFQKLANQLKAGERSHFFSIQHKDKKTDEEEHLISCYLRLHDGPDLTGIVRLEMFYNQESPKTFLETFEALIGLILEETQPSIYPTRRWDRQIYPIQICEEFLRTQIPPIGIMRATLKGLDY